MKIIGKSNVVEFIRNKNENPNKVQLMWLGQAGFLIKFNKQLLIIDPYLSDFLAKKYQNHIFPHIRLMESPILPNQIYNLDYFLSSHAHSDHMDPETIGPIVVNNPNCNFIVPSAVVKEAITRGMKKDMIIAINAHQRVQLDDSISISAVPAAHESLKTNEMGEHYFLGYIFHFSDFNIYHSGDCIPYETLEQYLKKYDLHMALLPINGRDEYRLTHKIAGNFHVDEVLNLCSRLKIRTLMVHHFGMFAYNTVSDEVLSKLSNSSSDSLEIIIPQINTIYQPDIETLKEKNY